jgi:hypothetical protein
MSVSWLCFANIHLQILHVALFFTKSYFEGLKVGAQISVLKPTRKIEYRALICAGCFGPSTLHFLGPQTAFQDYRFKSTVRDALTCSLDCLTKSTRHELKWMQLEPGVAKQIVPHTCHSVGRCLQNAHQRCRLSRVSFFKNQTEENTHASGSINVKTHILLIIQWL